LSYACLSITSISSPLCTAGTANVSFNFPGATISAGNVYTVQLSNSSGSFASPVNIGTLASTANSGTVSVTIPMGTPPGTGYRMRVIASNPASTGLDNGTNLTINLPPFVNVSSNSPVLQGNTISLSATGAAAYLWSGPNSFSASGTPQSIPNAQPTDAGTYTVTGVTSGCSTTVNTNVVVNVPAGALNFDGVNDYVSLGS